MSPRRRQGGFSLLEVLVAFAIMGVFLAVLLQVFSGALRNAALTEEYAAAYAVARSQLARAGTELPLEPGVLDGELGRFDWSVSVAPYRGAAGSRSSGPERQQLFRVGVDVSWSSGTKTRNVHLSSLRLRRDEGL